MLEALHRATGLPIVSDFYTHLYKPEAVSAQDLPLFETLCRGCDAMGQRWGKDAGTRAAGAWVQCRSMSFYEDRLKIYATRLDLIFVYVPGASHQRLIRIYGSGGASCQQTS